MNSLEIPFKWRKLYLYRMRGQSSGGMSRDGKWTNIAKGAFRHAHEVVKTYRAPRKYWGGEEGIYNSLVLVYVWILMSRSPILLTPIFWLIDEPTHSQIYSCNLLHITQRLSEPHTFAEPQDIILKNITAVSIRHTFIKHFTAVVARGPGNRELFWDNNQSSVF